MVKSSFELFYINQCLCEPERNRGISLHFHTCSTDLHCFDEVTGSMKMGSCVSVSVWSLCSSGRDQMTDPASTQRCSNSPAPHCISNIADFLTDVSCSCSRCSLWPHVATQWPAYHVVLGVTRRVGVPTAPKEALSMKYLTCLRMSAPYQVESLPLKLILFGDMKCISLYCLFMRCTLLILCNLLLTHSRFIIFIDCALYLVVLSSSCIAFTSSLFYDQCVRMGGAAA